VAGATHSKIDDLVAVSARLGCNPLLVQAGSGNTSVKVDGVLWIKASGKWLAHAAREEILVPVVVSEARATGMCPPDFALHLASPAGRGAAGAGLKGSGLVGTGLVPSIETAMHAVAPHAATIHVHSVNTIVYAVQEDGRERLAKRLDGLPWQWIPYVASGAPLAREVAKVFACAPETAILVLANHGLVVCGGDPLEAEALLAEVEQRLAIEARCAPPPNRALLENLARGSDWRIQEIELIHALSTDAISRRVLLEGILYPCQAIFLGPATPVLRPSLTPGQAAREYEVEHRVRPLFFLVDGQGALVQKNMSAAEREMLLGLAEIVQRIDANARLRYLSESAVASVLNADTYQYRARVAQRDSQ
jgi:rhamnose utilization protein RhaD (predicted bifunctional aldolase and dehydrogenase)